MEAASPRDPFLAPFQRCPAGKAAWHGGLLGAFDRWLSWGNVRVAEVLGWIEV